MNKPVTIAGLIILLNACIWGYVMHMSSRALSGTGAYDQIQNILSGGAGFSLILVGGGIAGMLQLFKTGSNKKQK